jgi:hypothetical protein
MIANYTQSRAAILCFGGWGLQVMFHLLPRLQAAQEQRAALGSLGPDLQDVTRFGLLMADSEWCAPNEVRLELFRPSTDLTLPPYYLEQTLAKLGAGRRLPSELTASERRAVMLLDALRPHLEPLGYGQSDFRHQVTGAARPTRRMLFDSAVTHADSLARLLETNLLDPIRHDSLDPDDPFVQTTLYVVAPLFEPLSSALIWPTVAQLLARTGRQHISQVVALLATGSYAQDLTRPHEDGATYVALRELEALSGLRAWPDVAEFEALAHSVANIHSHLAAQIGAPIFDYIYLLDREKSNQGLADDSHEVAVLAANALEANLVGGGNLHVQEQLGVGLHAGEARPYSLLGAATDYVPVAHVLHAINRQEESRLVREWVLRSTPGEDSSRAPLFRPRRAAPKAQMLHELGFAEGAALTALTGRLPELFVNPAPARIADLAVSPEFVLPTAVAADLRRLSTRNWALGFERHLAETEPYIALAVGPDAVDEAWGLQPDEWMVANSEWGVDARLFPTVVRAVNKQIFELVAASPAGLTAAQDQVRRWRAEAEQLQQSLTLGATPNRRELAELQQDMALRAWCNEYELALTQRPTFGANLLRGLLIVAVVALLTLGYLAFFEQPWDNVRDGLALAGFGAGILGAALVVQRRAATLVSRLRQQRVELAASAMTADLRSATTVAMLRMTIQLNQLLTDWGNMLDDAHQELTALATPPTMPAATPDNVRPTYLYRPHLSEELWNECLDHLRTQQDARGNSSDARLDHLWGDAEWRREVARIFRTMISRQGNDLAIQTQAQTLAELIRRTVRRSVAPVSLARREPARAELIRTLAEEYSIEHMLWRSREEAEELQRQLSALKASNGRTALVGNVQAFPRRYYIENGWNRAKPTANYDVSDRLAIYGVTVDFAAASGSSDTDLTRTLLQEYDLALLPTQDPFSITFVRTVHGLSLEDLDCMQRYAAEYDGLVSAPTVRKMLTIVGSA